jgi:magnesium transporter
MTWRLKAPEIESRAVNLARPFLESKTSLMITIHAWNGKTKQAVQFPEAALRQDRDKLLAHDVLWIDLAQPTPDEEQLVFREFQPVHPLTLEDITRLRREPDEPPHFPKVEEFSDYLFVIINPLTQDFLEHLDRSGNNVGPELRPFTQLSAVLTHQLLITHHYERHSCIDHLQTFLERHESQAERGPDYLFHLVLDDTVDQYAPVLDYIDDALDSLEIQVVQKPQAALFLKLLQLKRQIIVLRKTLIHEREVLVRLMRGEFELVQERECAYYRNVYDHLVRFTELMESSREMATDLMQSYLASTSNKLNEIMKVLTMISTVVLPMTLIAGIYGMNFKHMPELEKEWGYPFALGLMILTGVGSVAFFLWRKWL